MKRSETWQAALLVAAGLLATAASGQQRPAGDAASADWLTSWATAQEMIANKQDVPVLSPSVVRPDFSKMRGLAKRLPVPTSLQNQTIRMTVHLGAGGDRVRVEFTNSFSTPPVTFDAVHVALKGADGTLVPGTDRTLTFAGLDHATLQPGTVLVSDPVGLQAPTGSDMAVSIYVKGASGGVTTHDTGLHTAEIATGNVVADPTLKPTATTLAYLWLNAIDVQGAARPFTVVALGDSITDGFQTTIDKNRTWPQMLQERLTREASGSSVSVLNEGISGNEVLRNGAGVSALARFDRDVLAYPHVRWVILLEGINDINIRGQITGPDALVPADLIAGYQQIIARSHAHGIKVMGATLTPEKGVWLAGPIGEATRQKVNDWIRTSGAFDAVVDFDKVLRDSADPSKVKAEYNPGDNIHPNDAGNQAMADAIPLNVLLKQQ